MMQVQCVRWVHVEVQGRRKRRRRRKRGEKAPLFSALTASSAIALTPNHFLKQSLLQKESCFSTASSSPSFSQKCKRRGSKAVVAVMAPPQPQRPPSSTGSVKRAMTMTEKILARASERSKLEPGENVWVNVDVLMTHDVCGPGTIGIFKRREICVNGDLMEKRYSGHGRAFLE